MPERSLWLPWTVETRPAVAKRADVVLISRYNRVNTSDGKSRLYRYR